MSASRAEAHAFLIALLRDGLGVRVRVTGQSMRPSVEAGEIVAIRPIAPGALGLGDLVAYEGPRAQLVVHRLVARRGGSLITRGDALARPDEPVSPRDILGRVSRIELLSGVVVDLERPFLRLIPRLLSSSLPWPLSRAVARGCRWVWEIPDLLGRLAPSVVGRPKGWR